MVIISWKAFWSALGAVISLAIAVPAAVFQVPPLVTIPLAIIAGVAFTLAANTVVHRAVMFAQLSEPHRVTIVRWIAAGTVAHAVWITAFTIRPELWLVWLAALVLLAALTYWIARAHEYLLTQLRPPAPSKDLMPAAARQQPKDRIEGVFAAAMERAGFGWVNVLNYAPIGEPRPFGVRFRVRTPSRMALTRAGEKAKEGGRLTPSAAEPIAIALGEVLGTELESDWVRIRKETTAGTYSIAVVTEDVMSRVYPYEDTPQWTVVTNPALIGYELDGRPYGLRIDQHGQAIGKSTGGKSSLIHVEFAHGTRCEDLVIFVGGVEKLYDLVAGWIEPYMNSDHPLPFEWIASGQQDVLDMLVAAMNIARWRQRQPMSRRGNWPKILVVLDEASFALRNRAVRADYQGMAVTAAQMVAMLTQGAASGDVHVLLASQRSTNDHFGDQGGDTSANIGYSAAFRSNDEAEIGRLTGNYKLPMPRHRGEYWLDAGTGDMPVNLKAPYIQSIDPTKPRLHDGPTVADIAWSRRHFVRRLDPGSARAAGPAYERRLTRMDPNMLRYLTQAVTLQAPTRIQAGYDRATRELDALLGPSHGTNAAPPELAAPSATDTTTPGVTTLTSRRTRAERIVAIVRDAGGHITKADIVAALRNGGDDVQDDQVVTNALTKLVTGGELARSSRGLYTMPDVTISDDDTHKHTGALGGTERP